MQSYKELLDQIAALQKQAEAARAREINDAVNTIKDLMKQYGLTASDIGLGSKNPSKSSRLGKSAPVLYRDEAGHTWSGRGRMPGWLKDKDKGAFIVK